MSSDAQVSAPDAAARADHATVDVRSRRRTLRWVVPVAAAAVLGLVASGVLSANADPNLPGRTPLELLAAAGAAQHTGFSGTVVEKASLGLPDLSALSGAGGLTGATDQLGGLSLLSGSHTVRVWYGGVTQQRVALLDSLGENDVFRNGSTVWEWNSAQRVATKHTLPAALSTPSALASMSPSATAQRLLSLISPSTDISTDKNVQVAGRSAYELVLSPKDAASRIRQVRVAVDGKTMVPLSVQVYARDSERPALDIAYTRFNAGQPSADNFDWQPPAGVTVKQAPTTAPKLPVALDHVSTSVIGSSWTSVLKVSGLPTRAAVTSKSPQLGLLYGLLPSVKGSWGTGHLFDSTLVTALITDDGRLYAGAVDPSVLYTAAAKK